VPRRNAAKKKESQQEKQPIVSYGAARALRGWSSVLQRTVYAKTPENETGLNVRITKPLKYINGTKITKTFRNDTICSKIYSWIHPAGYADDFEKGEVERSLAAADFPAKISSRFPPPPGQRLPPRRKQPEVRSGRALYCPGLPTPARKTRRRSS